MTERGIANDLEVIIRGPRRSDVPALHAIMGQPGVIRGTTVMPCASEGAVEAALAEDHRHWFVATATDDRVLGYLYLDWGRGRWRRIASLVMAVRDDAVGRGVGRKLIDAAIHVGFQYLDLQRIELEVYVDNAAAIRLYERAGFVHEGTKRRNAIRDGVHVDGHMMAILKPSAAGAAVRPEVARAGVAYTDKDHLLAHNYGETDDYKVRSAGWERFSVNPVGLVPWVLDRIPLGEPLALLDAGAGLGRFALAVAERAPKGSVVQALDISRAMIDAVSAEARRRGLAVEATPGSIEDIPCPPDTFDVVLCNYVLYHVASIPRAIDELARVLRPGGLLISVVPSFRWLHELIDWQDRALLRLGHDIKHPLLGPTGTDRFCEDNAPGQFARRFRVLSRDRHDGTMRFPSIDELLHHYRHTMRFKNAVAAGVDEAALVSTVREVMTETLERERELRVTSLSACFVCKKEA